MPIKAFLAMEMPSGADACWLCSSRDGIWIVSGSIPKGAGTMVLRFIAVLGGPSIPFGLRGIGERPPATSSNIDLVNAMGTETCAAPTTKTWYAKVFVACCSLVY